MALSDIDRSLLERCLARKPRSWEEFVDRFVGLVIHVANHAAQARSVRLSADDREDLAAEVFLGLVKDDFAALRHFRGESSLATYLTVVARRIVVRRLVEHSSLSRLADATGQAELERSADPGRTPAERVGDRDQLEKLLAKLDAAEAQAVRMFHLEGKSYEEISAGTGLASGTIGPTLTRARRKMRVGGGDEAA
jgi:RNA polymerase sigma-70 factor (ECF subfamily)